MNKLECFTTDDGHFVGDVKVIVDAIRIKISAPGKPTYLLVTNGDEADGFVTIDGKIIALPGKYRRGAALPGSAWTGGDCWNNDETDTKICVFQKEA